MRLLACHMSHKKNIENSVERRGRHKIIFNLDSDNAADIIFLVMHNYNPKLVHIRYHTLTFNPNSKARYHVQTSRSKCFK